MSPADPSAGVEPAIRCLLGRAWTALRPPPPPDCYAPAQPDERELRWRRLDRVRDLLEQAAAVIARDGFTSGAWFSVGQPSGAVRLVTGAAALPYRDSTAPVHSSCLVGTLVRLADDPDTAATPADAWACVDELYEAMHEQLGHASLPPGRCYSPAERRSRLRGLTAWNDAPGRTAEQVLDLLERAVSRTILAAVR
jgi:hypothetical protein